VATTFHQPESTDEACRLIADNPEAKLIAGGQSLLPLLRTNVLDPTAFIDISRLDNLDYISVDGDTLNVGAGTTWAELVDSEVVGDRFPTVQTLSGKIGDVQVRNRGTVGGSLSHADPATDMGALLLCYDTEVVCQSVDGTRVVPLEEFFQGMFETTVAEDELLTEVRVTEPDGQFGSHYEKYEKRKGGFSMVAVGAGVTMADHDRIENLSVALTNCGPTPLLVDPVSELAAGSVFTDDLRSEIEQTITATADPIGDGSASREYKKRVAGKIGVRAIDRAIEEAR
jgi:carbon-monoxide dehydrogenase medium subunit